MLNFRAVNKINFVQCLIKRIDLAKRLFIMDIEEGSEVYIPNDLRNDKLPMSFQFYDPIMNIVLLKMADDRTEYFLKKSKIIKEFEENTIKH